MYLSDELIYFKENKWLVNKHRMIMCILWNRINQLRMIIKSINHKITYVEPPPKPDLSCTN